MNKNFILSGLTATVVNLLLNAGAYFFFLKSVFEAHPPVSAEFLKQLQRPADIACVVWHGQYTHSIENAAR
jgi:hypothetical protein